MLIQTFNQNGIVVDVADLASLNKKSTIHVLHVDDDPSLQEITKLMLLDLDSSLEIDNACCVDEGFSKLAVGHYDVVVSDYEMPQKDGLQFLIELRHQNNQIPFILFTGKGREEVAIKALNLGADGYHHKQGNPETVYGELAHTISLLVERSKTKQALVESEKRYRTIMEQAADSIIVHDKNLRIIDANEAASKKLGYTRDELLSMSITDMSSTATEDAMEDLWPKIIAGQTIIMEANHKTKSGNIVPVEVTLGPLTIDREIQVIGLVRDITERKKNEETLLRSEERFRQLSENVEEWVWEVDSNGLYTYSSSVVEKLLGYTPEEFVGKKHFYDLFVVEEREELKKAAFAAFASKSTFSGFVNRNVQKNGDIVWLSTSGVPILNQKGDLLGYRGLDSDITERKKVEQELKESEEKYKTLFEQAGDYTLILEAQATGVPIIFDANSSALQIHGYTREEIIGKPINFLDEESSNNGILDRLDKLLNNEKLTFETKHRRKDGSTIDVEVSIKKVKVGSKNLLVSVERDITERKKNEDALRQERSMLESVTKNIGAGLVMISKDYKILWMNNFLKQLTGASENNYCYSSFNTCNTICSDCGPKKIFEGAQFDSREYCNKTNFNEKHPVWFELIATPIKDADGNVVAALELTVNITEKKETEKKLKENSEKIELMNEKLRVVGGLTRHDARNKLSAMTGYAYLLKKKHADQVDIVEGLGKIEQAVKETARIFKFAKMYEQLGAEELTSINIEAKLNEAATLFSGSLPKIINECHGLTLLADSFLRQLFYNFIDNTKKYGQKTTTIKVHYQNVDENSLKLIYEDDGVGIPLENKTSLFKEGFSTGGSTGFGLFLTKKMIDVYGWKIEENGEPGTGAKFTITIPRLNQNGKENYQITK